jgi:SAM-dependent methyltransferase
MRPPDQALNELDGDRLYARLYDAGGVGWPGEIAFYRRLAADAGDRPVVLEVACGTGRVANELAAIGARVTGLDRSPAMIAVAAETHPSPALRWVVADMRAFELAERFDLVLVPGHSFQFMTTSGDRAAALSRMASHLRPGGRVVVHVDHPDQAWLDGLPRRSGRSEVGKVREEPGTGARYRSRFSWTYEPSTADATLEMEWELLASDGSVVGRIPMSPMRLHVPTREEMELAFEAAGLRVEALHGGFDETPFSADAPEMIWVARAPAGADHAAAR